MTNLCGMTPPHRTVKSFPFEIQITPTPSSKMCIQIATTIKENNSDGFRTCCKIEKGHESSTCVGVGLAERFGRYQSTWRVQCPGPWTGPARLGQTLARVSALIMTNCKFASGRDRCEVIRTGSPLSPRRT